MLTDFNASMAEWILISVYSLILISGLLYLKKSHLARTQRSQVSRLEKEDKKQSINEERLQLLQDATSDGIWDWDALSNEVYWSNKSYRMIGYEPGDFEINFDVWQKLVYPEDLPNCLKLIEASAQTAEPLIMEYRYRKKNGELLWVRVLGHCVRKDKAGRATRMIGSHIDLSESKIAEKEIQQKNCELEITNKALLVSNEKAEIAIKAKDEFLAIISHELRSPLNPIIGFSELLIEEADSEEVLENAKAIHQSSLAMLRLVDDMLVYMRIQRHSFAPSPTATTLQSLIRQSLDQIQTVEHENILAQVNYDSTGLIPISEKDSIIVDKDILQSVLTNLIENAFTYSNNKPITVLSGLLKDDPGTLRIEIIDQGIGIAEDKQKKIFDALYQVDSSFTRPYEGLGLGLAICKKATELLEGKIGVITELDKGSTFWVEIPIQHGEKNAAEQ